MWEISKGGGDTWYGVLVCHSEKYLPVFNGNKRNFGLNK
jgi:hypothetical protein